jgi:ABC-2 type transport system permease protein
MKAITIFRYEFNHFRKNKAKVFAFLLFVMACTYALYNGVMLQKKQTETIRNIEELANESQTKTLAWFDEGKKGPEDRPWIDVTTPFWALWNTPTYTIKAPSPLLPLGIGQAEQYGYYKQVTNWSSTYDNDMVEEIANPERLVNGNIDFSFLLLYLLPLLFIILTYNIYGLERDLNFDKLVHVQTGNTSKWIIARLGFYTILLLFTILLFITATALINGVFDEHGTQLMSLILLSTVYILVWAVSFYFIIRKSKGSSSIAFKMISVWLIFCVLIPGAVNQLSSMKYPANYMTDYLDANRKEAYEVFELENDSLSDLIMDVYPGLSETLYGQDSLLDEEIVGNTVSVLINQINKKAIEKIEQQNEAKNKLITSSYWYNPVTFFQNKWNSITSTDYYAYKAYRTKVQETIDKKIKLLVFECWNRKKVDKATYENYSILLR